MESDKQDEYTSFVSIIPADWRAHQQYNRAILRGYTSSISHSDFLVQHATSAIDMLSDIVTGPLFVTFGSIDRDRLIFSIDMNEYFRNGQRFVNIRQNDKTVSSGDYVFIASAYTESGEGVDEGFVLRKFDMVRGMLTALLGHTAMGSLVFEQRYNLDESDSVSYVSPTIENHLSPQVVFEQNSFAHKVVDVVGANSEIARRFELSLSFIGRASNELDHVVRFSHAWIALEIACGGHAAAKNYLNGLDGFASEAKRFADMRNDLFHHGKRPVFDQIDERFLHACVIAKNLQGIGVTDPAFAQLVKAYLTRTSKK